MKPATLWIFATMCLTVSTCCSCQVSNTTLPGAQQGEAQDGSTAAEAALAGSRAMVHLMSFAPANVPVRKPAKTTRPLMCRSRKVIKITWGLYMKFRDTGDMLVVPCGARLRFDWTGEYHGVARVNSFECPSNASAFRTIRGGKVSQFRTKTTFKTQRKNIKKPLYFACQVYGHCQSGQIIQVKVVSSK